MTRQLIMTLAIAAALAVMPPGTSLALIWDSDTATTGVQNGAGTWANGGTNWWDGSANVAWDNTTPTVAQFGSAVGTTAPTITVDETVKSTGVTGNHRFSYVPGSTNGGTIEMNGDAFTVSLYSYNKFYTPLTTAAGVNKIVFRGNGTRTDEYVYLYNANSFDAPIEIGEAESCAVFVYAGLGSTTPVVLSPSTAGLGGDSTKSITVFNGSTLGLRSDTVVDKPIILTGGTGYGDRGSLEFYGSSDASELRGSVTLQGHTTFRTRATGRITGSLTGDFDLAVQTAASNRPGAITLENEVNSSNSLTLGALTNDASCVAHLILAGNYEADEFVTIGTIGVLYRGEATIRSGATLTSPSVAVNNRGVLRGVGVVNADVIVAAGGTIEAGEADIYNSTDDVYYLDAESTIGTLTVGGNVTVAGTLKVEYDSTAKTIDRLDVSGALDLTQATLNLADVGASTLTGGPYVLASDGTLTGIPTVTGSLPEGYQLVYNYQGNKIALVPEPTMFVVLMGLALTLTGCRVRHRVSR
ncbi:MAG TPA: hypothetical protein DD670_10235 [Planctomycetaceae bacterium]|nr:hypothetical protein [Planctomycetaceae bacterium]